MAVALDMDPKLYAVDTMNGYQTEFYGDNIPGIFANLQNHNKPLVLWFHGGLVTRANGYAGAKTGIYGDQGKLKGFAAQDVEAIYYIYESGPLYEGVKAATVLLADDLIQSKISHLESFIRPLIHTGVADIVTHVFQGIDGFLRRIRGDHVVRARLRGLSGGEGSAFAYYALLNPSAVSADDLLRARVHSQLMSALTPADASRNAFGFSVNIDFASLLIEFGYRAVQVAMRVAARIKNGRSHGLTQTIIEEIVREYLTIGPEVWNQIKEEVDRSFSGQDKAAGTLLVTGLRSYLAAHPDRPVYLVGHSTGAIYLARFVMKARELGLPTQFHLRLLAGAARMDLYNDLFDNANDRVAEIVSFAMGDDPNDPSHNYEHQEYLFDVPPINKTPVKNLYQGSLLYMVSGALESDADQPLMGMQRYYVDAPGENAPPGDPGLKFKVIQVYSDTVSVPGTRGTKSHHHGGFGDDPDTFDSVLI